MLADSSHLTYLTQLSLLFTSTYSMAPHFLSIIIFGQRYCINSFEWFKTLKWILLLFFVWFIWINWWQLEERDKILSFWKHKRRWINFLFFFFPSSFSKLLGHSLKKCQVCVAQHGQSQRTFVLLLEITWEKKLILTSLSNFATQIVQG